MWSYNSPLIVGLMVKCTMGYLSGGWFVFQLWLHPVKCVFKISKCLPHYTVQALAAYLCFFLLLSPTAACHSTLDWFSLPPFVLSAALGIVLTSGCATSRHCQQQELPGVRIHCCDSDLCNSSPSWEPHTLHLICALGSLLLLGIWLWWNQSAVNMEYDKLSYPLWPCPDSGLKETWISLVLLVSTTF